MHHSETGKHSTHATHRAEHVVAMHILATRVGGREQCGAGILGMLVRKVEHGRKGAVQVASHLR